MTPNEAIKASKLTFQQKIDEIERSIGRKPTITQLEQEVLSLRTQLRERTEERDYAFEALNRVKGEAEEEEKRLRRLLLESQNQDTKQETNPSPAQSADQGAERT